MHNSKKFDLIDKFLSNQLSSSELKTFNECFEKNTISASDLSQHEEANNAIHKLGLLESKNKLDLIHRKRVANQLKTRFLSMSFLLIGLCGYGVYKWNEKPNKEHKVIASITEESKKPKVPFISSEKYAEKKSNVVVELDHKDKNINTSKVVTDHENNTPSFNDDKVDTLESIELIRIKTPDSTETDIVDRSTEKIGLENSQKLPIKNNIKCDKINLEKLVSRPSCLNKKDGEIIFSSSGLSGGTPPYEYLLYQLHENEPLTSMTQLASGEYIIIVKDAIGCSDTISDIKIASRRCTQRIDDSFSPSLGEQWSYPLVEEIIEYTLIIKDLKDYTIIEKQVDLDLETEWTGVLEDGTLIKNGVYILEINNEFETFFIGTLSII